MANEIAKPTLAGIVSLTEYDSKTMLDAMYLAWILIHKNKIIKKPDLQLDERSLMKCIYAITGGTDETATEYFKGEKCVKG